MTALFNLSLAGYFTALLLAAVNLLSKERRRLAFVATVVLWLGLIAQTAYIILRWIAAGRAPFSNMFESLVLFAWAIVAVYLVLRVMVKIPELGMAVLGVAAATGAGELAVVADLPGLDVLDVLVAPQACRR